MRILGVDIGDSSVKAIEIDSHLGRFEIHDYHEIKIEDDPFEAVFELLQSLKRKPDRIGFALGIDKVTFRNLELPTKDKKAIRASIGFELEDELPFTSDSTIYDYTMISKGRVGSLVHVAASLKKYVGDLVKNLRDFDIQPNLITSEVWAYRRFFNSMLSMESQEDPVMLVQIGAQRTSCYIHWRGAPVVAREIPWGGDEITRAIAKKYDISFEDAEQAKLDSGFILSNSNRDQATSEQVEYSDAIHESLKKLVSEIRQTVFSAKTIIQKSPTTVYLAGGSSLLPGLPDALKEEIHVPVRILQSLSAISASGAEYSETTDATMLLATSIALCHVGGQKSNLINLLKDEFAPDQGVQFNIHAFKRPVAYALIIGISMVASTMIQSNFYGNRIKTLDRQLEKAVRGVFPSISRSQARKRIQNPEKIRKDIQTRLDKQRAAAKLTEPNPKSPLDFLKSATSSLGVRTDLINIMIGASPLKPYKKISETTVSITAQVSDQKQADRLQKNFTRIADIKGEAIVKNTISVRDEKKQAVQVTINGTPKESAYGN